MIITYDNFDDSGREFEYETDLSDFISSLTNLDVINLARDLYENLDSDERTEAYPEIKDLSYFANTDSEDVLSMAQSIIEDSSDEEIFSILDDLIYMYYYDAAKDSYYDALAYEEDPYEYYGLNRKDFY